ncbi:prolyl oligopeptidase family serine peptidase, partial [Acinetobacter baumannii]|nr:prolyl oligopeptidase family serine peptidase [Acinetobacter baumannii]
TNRFKAAVTQRSISNWISFYGTSDIGPFFVKYQLHSELKDVDKLWKLSPLAYVENVETPLLVLHGEEDLRCPQEQGEQMYTAVKSKNIPTKMVVFPESSHGLSRQGLPNLRINRINEIIDWFSQY